MVASHAGGKAIILGGGRLFRVVLPDRSTIDFSELNSDLDTDLKQRDFTINSLAWSPKKGIIDPNRGLPDLKQRLLRMTSKDSLRNDPVRIMRAYRFAGEIDLAIELETRNALKELSSSLAGEKHERITLEFFKIMNIKAPGRILKMMLDDGVLEHIILQSYAGLRTCLKVISLFEKIVDVLPLQYRFKLDTISSQNLTYSGLLRLELLLRANSASRLRLSSAIQRRLLLISRGDALKIRAEREGQVFEDIIFDLFALLNGAAEDYLIINGKYDLLPLCRKYGEILQESLLSTGEICQLSGVQGGEPLGKLIRAVKKAHFYNEINNKEEARRFLNLIQKIM